MCHRAVYLAGAIDGLKSNKIDWRQQALEFFSKHGILCFNPRQAYSGFDHSTDHGLYIQAVNRVAVSQADVVLACLKHCSIGTAREIEIARTAGKPVVAFDVPYSGAAFADLFVCESLAEALRRTLWLIEAV